jgi:branched-subunit amino acid aminotransferase/4-amino-4-deoxychorismate lyase
LRISEVLVNGVVSDGRIAVTDSSVLRGDGCFEVLRAYGGRPFELEGHLDRLERSAARLQIVLPERSLIGNWVTQTARSLGDCAVRVVVTRGSSVEGIEGGPLVVVFAHDWPSNAGAARLLPVEAPWHSAGIEWDLAGAKILSYAPNVSATRRAKAAGFDDALLMTTTGLVLEGPTFSIAWLVDGVVETPSLDLGILDSITRKVVLDLARKAGLDVMEGSWRLDRLATANEVMALSTIREVQAVTEIGDMEFEPGPVTTDLIVAFMELVG